MLKGILRENTDTRIFEAFPDILCAGPKIKKGKILIVEGKALENRHPWITTKRYRHRDISVLRN